VSADQFILSRIDARNGAMGIVPSELDGAVVTSDFPTFDANRSRLLPAFLGWLSKTPGFVEGCRGASEGTTNRVRLKEDRFLRLTISLPPVNVQQRILTRIDRLVAKVYDAQSLGRECDIISESLLMSQFRKIVEGAPRRPLGDIAPLIRRPAEIDPAREYPQVSVRSFGKGTFHNPPLRGSEITWQKPHLVKSGDVLVSNIKAWEGAIAVAGSDDDGRYGSHRYLTFVPVDGLTTAHFVCFYLLSPEGLYHIGEASPGSADRNRTLSSKKMLDINVPVPPIEEQRRFDDLILKVASARDIRAKVAKSQEALLPSILDRAFKGDL
jgi:type I restriction enzyme S subunit